MAHQLAAPESASLAPDLSDDLSESERYRAERDHWRHMFDQLAAEFPEPVIVVDDDGRLTHWNEEQASFVGLAAEEALGQRAHEVIGTEAVTETLAEKVARTGETIREREVRTITNTAGEKGHGRAMGVPLSAPDGSVVGSFEVLYQVTDLVEQRESMEHVQTQVREELEQTVGWLEDASSQVTENVDVIAEVAEREAAHVREVDDEIQTFSATTQEVAASVETISTQSSETADLATDSEESTTGLLETVEDVARASDRMASDAEDLADRVAEIDDVVAVIDDIADQINILALNASIEAARAGEAGAGFAVVADEVKSLAAESKTEADRIEELVESISTIAADTVEGVEQTTARVEEIESQIETVNENQREIQASIADVSEQLEQIATATDEQATSAEDISAMLGTTVEGVERIATEVAELAAANEKQTEEVAEIRQSVEALERNLSSVVQTE
ncbi:methyl-accepting chemotaxis protein [Halobellus captivus]|uniref:methyl-accepting chemotaxis protein n=1 Tax=Halobellus captivus TaxID=2592614 RepID=UPI0011A7C9B3|nr:methyl-accepting chemotaxis protein [Halobellus captivus]